MFTNHAAIELKMRIPLFSAIGLCVLLFSSSAYADSYAHKSGDCVKAGYDREVLQTAGPHKGEYRCFCNQATTQLQLDNLATQIQTMQTFTLTQGSTLKDHFQAVVRGYQETPANASMGRGVLDLTISADGTQIFYTLLYTSLPGGVTQTHIRFRQPNEAGGVFLFLCTNLGNGPAGTQPCPAAPGEVSGTWTVNDLVGGATSQGIVPGDFRQVLRAIRSGVAYVNVNSNVYPTGEIRGQILPAP